MATAEEVKMNELTLCSLCLGRFTRPKMLPCQHCFCYYCLKGLAGRDVSLSCPYCRREWQIPDSGIAGFPDHFFMNNLLEIAQSAGKCAKCDEAAEKTCSHCQLNFCLCCLLYHTVYVLGMAAVSEEKKDKSVKHPASNSKPTSTTMCKSKATKPTSSIAVESSKPSSTMTSSSNATKSTSTVKTSKHTSTMTYNPTVSKSTSTVKTSVHASTMTSNSTATKSTSTVKTSKHTSTMTSNSTATKSSSSVMMSNPTSTMTSATKPTSTVMTAAPTSAMTSTSPATYKYKYKYKYESANSQ